MITWSVRMGTLWAGDNLQRCVSVSVLGYLLLHFAKFYSFYLMALIWLSPYALLHIFPQKIPL